MQQFIVEQFNFLLSVFPKNNKTELLNSGRGSNANGFSTPGTRVGVRGRQATPPFHSKFLSGLPASQAGLSICFTVTFSAILLVFKCVVLCVYHWKKKVTVQSSNPLNLLYRYLIILLVFNCLVLYVCHWKKNGSIRVPQRKAIG